MGGRRGVDVGEGAGRPEECRLGSACLAGDQAWGEEVVVFGCGRRLGQAAADTTHAPPCGPLITASHRAQPHLWLSSELTLRAVYPPTLPYSCGPRRNSGPHRPRHPTCHYTIHYSTYRPHPYQVRLLCRHHPSDQSGLSSAKGPNLIRTQ